MSYVHKSAGKHFVTDRLVPANLHTPCVTRDPAWERAKRSQARRLHHQVFTENKHVIQPGEDWSRAKAIITEVILSLAQILNKYGGDSNE